MKWLVLLLFLPALSSAASNRKVSLNLNQSDVSAINQNFDNIKNEFGNTVHITSTETIVGYKYFTNPVDFGTVTADSGTIAAFNASTGTFSLVTTTTITASSATISTGSFILANISSASISILNSPVVRYSPPSMVFITTNAIDLSTNTGTANQTCVLFGDGDYRCVTENTASADKYRRFIATATANFTSGTEDSGLRSTYVRTANTIYSIYAVKSQINASNYVVVGDTIAATRDNYAALNSAYQTNGWVPLGRLANGDDSGSTNQLLDFAQSGRMTRFRNVCVAGSSGRNGHGILLANATSATSLEYAYTTGTAGKVIPVGVSLFFLTQNTNVGSTGVTNFYFSGSYFSTGYTASNFIVTNILPAGVTIGSDAPAGSNYNFYLSGWIDDLLTGTTGAF